jgi:hypothetical protein
MPIRIKVSVRLCRHRSYLGAQGQPGIPVPAGVEVELISVTSGEVISLGKTTDKGATEFSRELDVDTYQLRLCGLEFELSEEFDVTAADNRKTKTFTLAPCDDKCLLLLRLVEEPAAAPVPAAMVHVTGADGHTHDFTSASDGLVVVTAPQGDLSVEFDPCTTSSGTRLLPVDPTVSYTASPSKDVIPIPIVYRPAVSISVQPTIATPDGATPTLTGASVTVDYRGSGQFSASSATKQLTSGTTVDFEYPFPGVYVVAVAPPTTFGGFPVAAPPTPISTSKMFSSGGQLSIPALYQTAPTEPVNVVVTTPQGEQLNQPLTLRIASPDNTIDITQQVANSNPVTVQTPVAPDLVFRIDGEPPQVGRQVPLQMSVPNQPVVSGQNTTNTIELIYQHSISGTAVDERGQPVAGATLAVLDENQTVLSVVAADDEGGFEVGVPASGYYYLSQYPEGGVVGRRERVEVHSTAVVGKFPVSTGSPAQIGGGAMGSGKEALTDLSAYPLLTEEITTTGPPSSAGGGAPTAGGPTAGYGPAVDQVIRDVLGWRPSGDAAGFQAALSGAFALRQVEGHTEWSWQQRGYAVQADMGALTGAQASIYARATSALDQILPLLAGLTSLNPASYPPQDLEAIRTIITAELQELVNELALEGGPRIQRVDELFSLLTGGSRKSAHFDPELVQGQLGVMGLRFGLNLGNVTTLDEERILTNFRIVVEQVLSLQDSWQSDRKLLSVQDSNTSLGTILIRLGRGLEAVCESVDDLTFALDSVFVDAAQRQVIQLQFSGVIIHLPILPLWKHQSENVKLPAHQAPILLSDLLDWVVRACRDEGPKIVQDAGKDGVLAFAPILNELRRLISATRTITHRNQHATLPDGMRTPRVRRALEVLAAQLDEAADLATLVQRVALPMITDVTLDPDISQQWLITVEGVNLRRNPSVFLFAANRQDKPDVAPRGNPVSTASGIRASFAAQSWQDDLGYVDWQVAVVNQDGTASQPVEVVKPSQN